MRLAFTIGLTNDGEAVILKDHKALLREHKNALNSDEYKGEYSDVFILESSRANKKKRFSIGGKGVNHGAALPVEGQTKKKMSAIQSQRGKGAAEGKVHFDKASLPVAEQKKPSKKRSPKKRASKKAAAGKSAKETKPAAPAEKPDSDSGPTLQ